MLKQGTVLVFVMALGGGMAHAKKSGWTKVRDKVEHKAATTVQDVKHDAGVAGVTVAKDVKDGATTVAKDVKDGAQNAHERLKDVRQDVRDGRYGEAIKDSGAVVNDVVPGAGSPLVQLGSAGEDATREGKAANRAAHEGAYGRAVEHVGNVVTDSGEIVAVVDPILGAAVVAAGRETTAAARTGERVNEVVHDVANGDAKQAIHDAMPCIKTDVTEAAMDLRDGKLAAAAEHAGAAVNAVSPGSGDQVISAAQEGKAATADEHEAVADAHAGRLGDAGVKTGNAIVHVGDAVKTLDPDKADAIKATGTTISETAEKAKAVAKTGTRRRDP